MEEEVRQKAEEERRLALARTLSTRVHGYTDLSQEPSGRIVFVRVMGTKINKPVLLTGGSLVPCNMRVSFFRVCFLVMRCLFPFRFFLGLVGWLVGWSVGQSVGRLVASPASPASLAN